MTPHPMINLLQDFLNWTGSSDPSGNKIGVQYNFWSGIGSDMGEFTIIAVMITGFIHVCRHFNCAQKGCLAVPLRGHPVEGTHLHTCHNHATQAIHEQLQKEHAEKFPEQHAFLNKDQI